MPPPQDADVWSLRVQAAFGRYAEPLLREVAARLVKARTAHPADELADKCFQTLMNPPVIDRRVKDLPVAARKLLTLIGLSRRPTWKVGHLLTLLAAVGHSEGLTPVLTLLDMGLLVPDFADAPGPEVTHFEAWLGANGTLLARVSAHPAVAARARTEPLDLPVLPTVAAVPTGPRFADGLDWVLRLALVWQQVAEAPVRLTQAHTLFKRDLGRLQADELLAGPTPDQPVPVPDPGVLALFWAEAAGLLATTDGELRAVPFPPAWRADLLPTLAELWAGVTAVEPWDAAAGYAPPESGLSAAPTAGFLALLLLAHLPAGAWAGAQPVADWLWDRHPSWQGTIPRDHAPTRGRAWVEAYLLGVAYPLRFVEAARVDDDWVVRLTDIGRHFLANAPEPTLAAAFPQALLVQPNAEVLAYRQGLTPGLIGKLTRLAKWKTLGPACTLELNAGRTYHGLESGLTLAGMLQTLNQHALKPVPPSVADLLRRWADKRDRITVLAAATLVEFQTPADLDSAVARGVVSIRVTDRIGLTDDGRDPEFKHLRLIGNRDYEARPQQCVGVGPDGITLTVDTAHADLLLEAEIVRLADPVAGDPAGVRRFRVTPATLKRRLADGVGLADIDAWFQTRAGQGLPPALRLFAPNPQAPGPTVGRHTVVHLPTPDMADGLTQWPPAAELVGERLGPTAVAVADENVEALRAVLAGLGITLG